MTKQWFLAVLLLAATVGCSKKTLSLLGISDVTPEVIITKTEKVDASPGSFAKLVITLKNTGGSVANSIWCSVRLKKGNEVIESGTASFSYLLPGEVTTSRVLFSEINSHTEYDVFELSLFWEDDEGGQYVR